MRVRLMFVLAFFALSITGGYGIRPAQAGFCTVQDIQEGIRQNVPLPEIRGVCTELDVNACDAQDIYYMLQEGFTLSDIYYECRQ